MVLWQSLVHDTPVRNVVYSLQHRSHIADTRLYCTCICLYHNLVNVLPSIGHLMLDIFLVRDWLYLHTLHHCRCSGSCTKIKKEFRRLYIITVICHLAVENCSMLLITSVNHCIFTPTPPVSTMLWTTLSNSYLTAVKIYCRWDYKPWSTGSEPKFIQSIKRRFSVETRNGQSYELPQEY